ncbi:MAG: hypothetical protein BWY00_00673 [Firmicutes bacterium ADurb.Bin153]|nr:MAG: hypothetical protein BWY00_00673 [Firmicutes bacterium ADurb.Bin153]
MGHSNKVYIAIIGDIKRSREIEDRKYTQELLMRTLDDINRKYDMGIAAKFTITLGDEFQGLLNGSGSILAITSEIERRMFPERIRFGIGIGRIFTAINPEKAIGADGPVYYEARKAIEYIKRAESRKGAGITDTRVQVEGDEQMIVELINASLALATVIKCAWSRGQREAIWSMLEQPDTQTEVAKRLGISQPTLQKALAAGEYYTYVEAIRIIEEALGYIEVKNA